MKIRADKFQRGMIRKLGEENLLVKYAYLMPDERYSKHIYYDGTEWSGFRDIELERGDSDLEGKWSRRFPARYDGDCSGCSGTFYPGDDVRYHDDAIVCSDCSEKGPEIS